MKTSHVLLGIVAGFAAGAAVGILFAPYDGKTTKRKIGQAKDDLSNELKNHMNVVMQKLVDKYETITSAGSDLIDKGKEKVEAVKAEYSSFN